MFRAGNVTVDLKKAKVMKNQKGDRPDGYGIPAVAHPDQPSGPGPFPKPAS